MNPRELNLISALAVFLTAALPTTVGTIAFRAQPILQSLIVGEVGQLPSLTGFYFNHFTGALIGLLILGLLVTWIAFKAHRQNSAEPAERISKVLVALCFSSLLSILFLSLLILATALPVYAKLTER